MAPLLRTGPAEVRHASATTLFLVVVLAIMAVYTQLAFGMDWRTAAGRIGPGFFPRIVGLSAVVLTLAGLWRDLHGRNRDEGGGAEEEAGDADLGRHPSVLFVIVALLAVLVVVFQVLGAILSGVLFLLAALSLLNPGRLLVNVATSIGLPLLLYVLFQTLLNAGLPPGLLPAF